MNKTLHVLVYLFLILAAASLWFELELNKISVNNACE